MHNLKGSQFLLRFLTAESEVVPNAARNIPSPLCATKMPARNDRVSPIDRPTKRNQETRTDTEN